MQTWSIQSRSAEMSSPGGGVRGWGTWLAPRHSMHLLPARVVVAIVGTVLTSTGMAAGPEHPGRSVYLQYCAACHGPGGKGDGVAGTFMRPKPTELTQIAKEHGGKFPFQSVMQQIDGTITVRAHGDPDMPVWGEVFRDESTWDAARRAAVRGKLMLITDYVQSIQEE